MHGSTASGEVLSRLTVYLLGRRPGGISAARAGRSLGAAGGRWRSPSGAAPRRVPARHLSLVLGGPAHPLALPGSALRAAARTAARLPEPGQDAAARDLPAQPRHRVRRGGGGLRPRAPAWSGRHLDHRGDAGRLPHAAPARPRPLGGSVAAASSWSEVSTAWRWVASSSGRACSPSRPMPRRSPSPAPPGRCSTPGACSSTARWRPTTWPASGRATSRADASSSC